MYLLLAHPDLRAYTSHAIPMQRSHSPSWLMFRLLSPKLLHMIRMCCVCPWESVINHTHASTFKNLNRLSFLQTFCIPQPKPCVNTFFIREWAFLLYQKTPIKRMSNCTEQGHTSTSFLSHTAVDLLPICYTCKKKDNDQNIFTLERKPTFLVTSERVTTDIKKVLRSLQVPPPPRSCELYYIYSQFTCETTWVTGLPDSNMQRHVHSFVAEGLMQAFDNSSTQLPL